MNTNDCVLGSERHLNKLQSLVDGSVDVLLTQFSYACYVGETYAERRACAEHKLAEMKAQIDVLAPRYLIPFASYVYFCHEENFHMNDAINRIDAVYEHFRSTSKAVPIVLDPGDTWTVGTAHDCEQAVQRYVADYEAVRGPLVHTVPVDRETLEQSASAFHGRLSANVAYLQLLRAFRVVRPLDVYVRDHGCAYRLDLASFTPMADLSIEQCGIVMSSQTLNFCMKFDYGWNTTAVSGKFEILQPEAQNTFNMFTSLGDAMNHGRVTWGELFKGVQRRVGRHLWPDRQAA